MKRSTFALGLNLSVILKQILPLANKTTNDDYLTSNIFLFHLLIYSLRDEGILLEIMMGPYRSLQPLLFAFVLFASFSYTKDALGFQTLIDSKVPKTRTICSRI